ncbi:hypothetical protein [Palaeococcus ferrophilus]|uniref:hypothetical protein n=1 Tax=Palaeococcus ferrophilus TaxID=83868 RepID=UPI0012FB00B3|nr:hypothetical protein [Palaeococcus ferrophilus]
MPAWEYPKLSLFYRLLTSLTAMKHNLDLEDAFRALSVELPKRLGHRVPKPEEIDELEKKVNELVQEGLLPETAKQDVVDLAKELSQIVYEVFPDKKSVLKHREKILTQINKDRSWGVKGKSLGDYWYEVVLEDVLKKHSNRVSEIMKRGAPQVPKEEEKMPTTKTITKTEPSVEEKALQALKSMGIDVKLEGRETAERKAKIFAWLEREGLVEVEEENGKPVVVPTEEFHRMVSRVGPKAAAAVIKKASEENEPLSRALRIAKVLEALDGKLPEGKGVIRSLNLFTAGLLSLEDLSRLWGVDAKELLKSSPGAVKALLEAMEEFELTAPEVPVEWLPILERLRDNPTEEDLRRALSMATVGRMTFSALESTAIRGLPERSEEIEALLSGILRKTPELLPFSVEIPGELEEEFRELSRVLALMKDASYLEKIEAEVSPLVEKLPEGRVGLFRRESPRKRVEDFAVLLTEGSLSEEEAEERAEELKGYLKSYLSGEEAEKLVDTLLLPFRAKRLKERYGSAEGFLFEYAHARASRYLLAEAYVFEALMGEMESLHDALVRVLAGVPSLGREKVSLKGVERNRRELESLLGE